jgi:hypothetical protein
VHLAANNLHFAKEQFLLNRKRIKVKKIYNSRNRRLWVIVVVSIGLTLQYIHAQNVNQVQVYDVISNQNVCFGETFNISAINIHETVATTFGTTGSSNTDSVVITPPVGFKFTSVNGTVEVNPGPNSSNIDVDKSSIGSISVDGNGAISFAFKTEESDYKDTLNVSNLVLTPILGSTIFGTSITVSVNVYNDGEGAKDFTLSGYNMQSPSINLSTNNVDTVFCEFDDPVRKKLYRHCLWIS